MFAIRRIVGIAIFAAVIGSAGAFAVAPGHAAAATTYTKTATVDFYWGNGTCYCFNGTQVKIATITASASWQNGVNGDVWGNSVSVWSLVALGGHNVVSKGFFSNYAGTVVTFWANIDYYTPIPGTDEHFYPRVTIAQGGGVGCYSGGFSRGPLAGGNYIGCTIH